MTANSKYKLGDSGYILNPTNDKQEDIYSVSVVGSTLTIELPKIQDYIDGLNQGREYKKKYEDLLLDNAQLQQQYDDLQEEFDNLVAYYSLAENTNLTLNVKSGSKFLLLIASNSSFLYLDSEATVLVDMQNFTGEEFVDYSTLSAGSYSTPGFGFYLMEVISISGETSTQITLDLTTESR